MQTEYKSMKKICILALLWALLGTLSPLSGQVRFRNFSTDDGLPDNSVRAIFQDSNGLLWLCTREGVCMYDGLHFMPLRDPSCDILQGLAMSLAEDRNHRLWFVTTRGIGFHDLETGETRTVHRNTTGGIVGAADIAVDRGGRVWIANEGLYCWDPAREILMDYSPFAPFRSDAVESDSNGNLWFLSTRNDLFRYNSLRGQFETIREGGPHNRTARHDIVSDGAGHILFSGEGGIVYQADIFTNQITPRYRTGVREIRCIIPDKDGQCWLGTERGILITDGQESSLLTHSNADPDSIAGEDVWSLLMDRQGNMWVGMFYNGLSLSRNHQSLVHRYMGRQSGGPLAGDMVRPVVPVDDGHLLVGTEDGGLTLLNLSDGTSRDFTLAKQDGAGINVQGVCVSDGEAWVATFGNGVLRLDLSSGKILKQYLADLSAASIYRTMTGEILAGTISGLYRYDPAADDFTIRSEFGQSFVHALFEDSRGQLWVGTYGDGLWTGKDTRFRHITVQDRDAGLTSDYITCIREDSRHRIWVLTEAGGACYAGLDEVASGTFRFGNLSRRNGFPASNTCCLQEDLDQVLWITTTHGIVKLSPDDLSIQEIFLEDQGNTLNQYAYGSACATSGGQLFFGTSRGLVSFSPSGRGNRERPRLLITEISATGPGGPTHITEEGKSVLRTDKIRIRYADVSTLRISFSAPDFQSSRTGMFIATLEGGRKSIQSLSSGEVTFTDLAPGKYRFTVSGIGARRGSSRSLAIEIVPPFYRSRIACIFYLLAALTALFLIGRQWDRLRQMRMTRKVEKMEAEKQKELYDAKINFFTNITHEIRTPLSLIKMPLDKIIASGNYSEANKQELLTMQANAGRLLQLTNQLLDLRKMERMEIRPVFLTNDLSELVRRTCVRFAPVAEDQHIDLKTELPDGPFPVECAGEMVERIVGNLLSNACKYGNGHILVRLEPVEGADRVRIRVNSDGERIPELERERIFEKFYQAATQRQSQGTGLGLPYARSLAVLHGGSLELDPTVRDWNSFVLELPVHQEARVEIPSSQASEETEETPQPFDSLHHTILVVEDDPDMRGYLAKELSEEYNVLVAANGEDALKMIGQERIDLVVSDIMMPGMDGCTLCNRIKSTTELSHIPVLLLTAAVGMETRIETLEAGADGYIEKPFAIELLQANIANLFKNREIAYRQFTHSPLSHFSSVVTGGMDQEFMEHLHAVVMKHLSEPDLNIETLTGELGTSKSTLYRKVTANTGLNINEYIRVSRLKQAAEMLSSQKYRISEVAYMTGFSSPSYFATCFQKQFNVSPSTFLKGLKG